MNSIISCVGGTFAIATEFSPSISEPHIEYVGIFSYDGAEVRIRETNCRKLFNASPPPPLPSSGGINEMVDKIADQCSEQGLPMVFALSWRRMAYVLKKKHNIGCAGIFSYDGAEVREKRRTE